MNSPIFLIIIWVSVNLWTSIHSNNIIPILQEYSSNITTQFGSTLKISCPILVNSRESVGFYISWTVNDVDENMLSMDLRYEFLDGNKIIQVKNVRSEDAGTYKCKGVTGYGVREATFYIQVLDGKYCHISTQAISKGKYKPCFLNSLMQNELSYHKVVKDVGESVKFDCFAAGHPSPEYLWMKGKSSADWIDNITSIRQPMLQINNIRLEYAGHYTCKVYNPLGEISYTYTLIVREQHSSIPKILDTLNNVTTKLEAQAILVGTISCKCKPIIQWLKKVSNRSTYSKSVQIPNAEDSEKNEYYNIIESDTEESRISIETEVKDNGFLVTILRFKSVTQDDAGKYVLFATRGNYGLSYRTVHLEIQDKSADNSKKNHPRLIIYIAIPIFILIICFAVIFYCWSRNSGGPRTELSKSFCIGSSSVSSSTNVKSYRSQYPPSTGTGSAATGKYSNGSSITTGKKNSSGTTDMTLPQSSGGIPLLPQQSSSRSFSPAVSVNVIQESLNFDPSVNSSSTAHFNPTNDSIHFSYAKTPAQQINFPHSNSRMSNSSHPNTNSSSSNCSDHTSMSFSNPLQPNIKVAKSQSLPPSCIQLCPPTIAFSVTSSHLTNFPVPPYYIQHGFDSNLVQQTPNTNAYPQYSDVVALVNTNPGCAPDHFPGHNSSSPSNTYSFT